MGPEENSDILYATIDGKPIGKMFDFTPLTFSVPDIPVWKKRKTLVKKLMALGFSRNCAEEEAQWIKLGRKLDFSGIGYKLNIVDEWNSYGIRK